MEHTKRIAALTLAALACTGLAPAAAFAAKSITAALTGGKVTANLRLRYETVDQDGIADEAEALTLRTRIRQPVLREHRGHGFRRRLSVRRGRYRLHPAIGGAHGQALPRGVGIG